LAGEHDAVISAVAGRVAVPAAYLGARHSRRPYLLWASFWRHPRTPTHFASFPLMRHLYRRSDAVLTYGPHVSRYVTRHRGDDRGVIVAPQAVEQELFGRAVQDAEVAEWREQTGVGEGPLVLFVGRLVADKGVPVLLDAWRGLKERGDARLCLVGDGPLAARHNLFDEPGVVLAGRQPRERLATAYAAAEVVVVPSIATRRFLEPWGLVCNEAMSQGRPVIATDAVGAAAGGLVRHEETGLVVAAGDENALAGAIGRLLGDSELREQLGRRGGEEVSAYSYEAAADAFAKGLEFARVRL
jgi:glycosyltransferase involved in cell wall biosynthesis